MPRLNPEVGGADEPLLGPPANEPAGGSASLNAGYSETPLAKKLGIASGTRLHLVAAPRSYLDLLDPLSVGVVFVRKLDPSVDIEHIFVTERARLVDALVAALPKLRSDAAIWVSWPKKASKVATDITEDTIRELALPMGLVDIKVCAVDETWSGLKLVIRKESRAKR